jgi:hypothetical protein
MSPIRHPARSHQFSAAYATESHVRYPTKVQWFVTWLGASVLSLLVLGVLLEMHC